MNNSDFDTTIGDLTKSLEQLQLELERCLAEAEGAQDWEAVKNVLIKVLKAMT
jgi:hypothetical protein